MLIVYCILLLLSIMWACYKKDYKIFLFNIFLLIIITGLRYGCGYDLDNYLIHFGEINSLSDVLHSTYEIGYSFVVLLFKNIGFGFQTLLFVIACVAIFLKSKTMNKLSPIPILSFLIYFLVFFIYNDFTQIRHGLAIGLTFYAILFIDENKWKYWGLILLACLFHYSAICFIPIYFIRNINLSWKSFGIICIVSILLSLVNIPYLLNWLNNSLLHWNYLTNKLTLYQDSVGNIFEIGFFLKIVFLMFFLFFAYDNKNKVEKLCVNIYAFGIFTFGLLSSFSIIAYRTNTFFRMAELILLPIYITKIPNMKYKWLHCCFVGGIFVYYLIKFLLLMLDPAYFNYHSI